MKSRWECFSEFPVEGSDSGRADHFKRSGSRFDGKTGMVISLNEEKTPFVHTLHLVPRIVTLGLGCRKGKPGERNRRGSVFPAAEEPPVHSQCETGFQH